MRSLVLSAMLVAALSLTLAACGKGDDPKPHDDHAGHAHAPGDGHDHDHDHAPAEPHHRHDAPNGGALVPVGPAHLEFKLDAETGKITAYVLDGEAKKGVWIDEPSFVLNARIVDKDGADVGKPSFEATFKPVADPLTGDTAESSTKYEATVEDLKGAVAFEGSIGSITIKGTKHSNVSVNYPKGNE